MPLWRALGISPGDVVAFTGGGGKTSLCRAIARELASLGRPVIFTTTTKIFPAPDMEPIYADHFGERWVEQVARLVADGRPVCVGARLEPGTGKVLGLTGEQVAALKAVPGAVILVEADGSNMRPLKVPASHEPVIPPVADIVVPVAGASAFWGVLDAALVHRHLVLAEAAGVAVGSRITPALVADALVSAYGCVRGAPAGARVVPVLSQADLEGVGPLLEETAALLLGKVGRVLFAAAATSEPVRGVRGDVVAILLAGGASRRFGGNKLLHNWRGRTLIEHSLTALLRASVKEVIVVTGAYHRDLAPVLAPYPVRVVPNPDWEQGMSTSLRAGMDALLGPQAGVPQAVILCLADQPLLPPAVIDSLAAAHRRTGAPIVAPATGGLRRNPVLFDQRLFSPLRAVEGDQGGREVIRAHQEDLVLVPCADERWFMDIDTAADLPG